jgi:hypothetical protein
MDEAEIRIHCEPGHDYVGFVASISVDHHGFHQRTTLSDFTPELALVAAEVKADCMRSQRRTS